MLCDCALTIWQDAGNILMDQGILNNYGNFLIQNNAAIEDAGLPQGFVGSVFDNAILGGTRGSVSKGLPAAGGDGTVVEVFFQTEGDLALSGATMTFRLGLSQDGLTSLTDLDNGVIAVDAGMLYDLSAGRLQGFGTIKGSMQSVGTIEVGSAIGSVLAVTGNFAQTGGELRFYASNANWGQLQVGDNAVLLVSLITIDAQPGYNPPAGFTKRVVTTGGAYGGFLNNSNWTLQPGANFLDVVK